MGCISGKLVINDQQSHIFKVINEDEMGHFVSQGILEVTETELVFHQRFKPPTVWPVRCLRKYGFDSEIFSFESGRRCPTGAGIYAFRCRKAEQIFNLLQQNIQLRNLNIDNNLSGLNSNLINSSVTPTDFPVPLATNGPPVHRRLPSISDGYLNPTTTANTIRPHPSLSRPGSVTSNGPASPQTVSPPPTLTSDVSFEHNNNNQSESIVNHSYINTSATVNGSTFPAYINLGVAVSPTSSDNYVNISENTHPLYMNIMTNDLNNTKEAPKILPETTNHISEMETEDIAHCYANISVNDPELVRTFIPHTVRSNSGDMSEDHVYLMPLQACNYIELDLDAAVQNVPDINLDVESPTKIKKGYATIDFNKTNALSKSIKTNMDTEEEGSRKTRHNSTISEVSTRQSNSLTD